MVALRPELSENHSVRFVLVRPRDPNNIGAAARAMANFGFDDLALVNAWDPTWREAKAAVGASRVIEEARSVSTLDEAIGDCEFVVATTAATRRRLDRFVGPKAAFASMREQGIEPSRAAILFGNEKHGLSSRELDRAHAIVVIPTSALQPSLNLSHAVALMAWEAGCAFGDRTPSRVSSAVFGERRATVAEMERLVAAATESRPGRADLPHPEGAADRLRQILLRSNVTISEVQFLFSILNSPSDNDTTQ